jgi:hypothetical protein
MSNEPMLGEPVTIEPAPSHPAPRTSGRSVDAELVLAAIDRMEAAIGRERATLDRLRVELAAMAQTIAQAKIAVQPRAVKPDAAAGDAPLDVAALLDELEHRVDAMLEIGGRRTLEPAPEQHSLVKPHVAEAPAGEVLQPRLPAEWPAAAGHTVTAASPPPAPAEPDRVPTVSDVVSRLGRASHAAREESDSPAADTGTSAATNVSMLEAMVLALSALDVVDRREAEAPVAEAAAAAREHQSPETEAPDAVAMAASRARLPEVDLVPPAPQSLGLSAVAGAAPDPADHVAGSVLPADPLAPVNAMSAEEKIALFS